jgi:hypothetical protein
MIYVETNSTISKTKIVDITPELPRMAKYFCEKEVDLKTLRVWNDYCVTDFYSIPEAKLWIAKSRIKVLHSLIDDLQTQIGFDETINIQKINSLKGEISKNRKIINKLLSSWPELGL